MEAWKARALGGMVLLTGLALTVPVARQAASPREAAVKAEYFKQPLRFEANRGQTGSEARYLARGSGYTLFLTDDAAVLALRPAQDKPAATVSMQLLGANATPTIAPLEEQRGKTSYFIGKDPAKWRTNVPTYARVRYAQVYPGIDLLYYGNQRQLEFDFVVAPGGDPGRIQLGLDTGAKKCPRIDGSGDLVLATGSGDVRLHKPIVYQPAEANVARRPVEGAFVLLAENRVGFEIGAYDPSRTLVIDPVLGYASFLGGSSYDAILNATADAAGNAVLVGYSSSLDDFPQVNALFEWAGYSADAFVTKIDSGGQVVFSTFLGGNGGDVAQGVAVDGDGYIYVTGFTDSTNFPTPFGFQTEHADDIDASDGNDAFLVQLSHDGLALLYGTYLGGTNDDEGEGVAVDPSGHAYVTGRTGSSVFPTTDGAFMETGGGIFDAFVAKFDPAQEGAASLVYSTHLGGSERETGRAIAVDADGNAYVTGYTLSNDFPTHNPLYPDLRGVLFDSFVSKLNADGSALLFSTYLGGNRAAAFDIALDASRNIHVVGLTEGTVPTVNALDAAIFHNDAFVSKIRADGTGFVYSTYLGGGLWEEAHAVAVDSHGNAYVAGSTGEIGTVGNNFPLKRAVQSTPGGDLDAFVTKINPEGSALIYSTYLGGSGLDQVLGIGVDGQGNAYVAGTLDGSEDFPVVNAFQDTHAGGTSGTSYSGTNGISWTGEGFVAKISLVPDFGFSATPAINATVGGSGSTTVTVNSLDAFNSAVALSVASPPAGYTPSFNPTPVTPAADGTGTSTLTVALGLAVVPGSANLSVNGTSGTLSRSTPVQVNVTASPSGTSNVVDGLTAIGCIDNAGVSGALLAKLARAQAFIDAGDTQAAINTLNALLNQLQAQKGKHIVASCTDNGQTFDPAAVLIAQVQALLQSLGVGARAANPITGFVLTAQGAPVAGAQVTLTPSNSLGATAVTDALGYYYFPLTRALTSGTKYTAKLGLMVRPFTISSPSSQAFVWKGTAVPLSPFQLR